MLKDAGLSRVEDVLVGKLAWPSDPYLPQSKCSVTYYHGFRVGRKGKYQSVRVAIQFLMATLEAMNSKTTSDFACFSGMISLLIDSLS